MRRESLFMSCILVVEVKAQYICTESSVVQSCVIVRDRTVIYYVGS